MYKILVLFLNWIFNFIIFKISIANMWRINFFLSTVSIFLSFFKVIIGLIDILIDRRMYSKTQIEEKQVWKYESRLKTTSYFFLIRNTSWPMTIASISLVPSLPLVPLSISNISHAGGPHCHSLAHMLPFRFFGASDELTFLSS